MALSLRVLRRQNGLTLEALADRAGLTKSYLSKLERGQRGAPSISVAISLANALGVEVSRLFGEQADTETITVDRATERTALAASETRYDGVAVGMVGKQMLPFVLYPPTDETQCVFREHGGDEFVLVQRGVVELLFPDRQERLDVGDSAYFCGGVPHRFRSVGQDQAEVVVVIAAADNPYRR